MRLLKTGPYLREDEKLEVIQQWGNQIPKYAILSHTWSQNLEDEVLLSDVKNGTCHTKPAYGKLEKALEQARLDGYAWLWLDSCCIDQTSNVDLSEAINSMYRYYGEAKKCYAYLSDVKSDDNEEQFKSARWWRRGWTLQELLAPAKLEFFNAEWKSIGYKHDLHETITEITGIEQDYLANTGGANDDLPGSVLIQQASVAKRMSWAANRETKREEDIAYCLIGIFDINMPMLYGEGATRAFLRLQEEIMRVSEDQSLLAWTKNDDNQSRDVNHGLLADSPKDFERSGNIVPYTQAGQYSHCTMTARGLSLTLPLTSHEHGVMLAALHCPVPSQGYCDWIAVYLRPLRLGADQYSRVACSRLATVQEPGTPQQVYIRQHLPSFAVQTIYPYHFFQLRSLTRNGEYNQHVHPGYNIVRKWSVPVQRPAKDSPSASLKSWCKVAMVYRIDKTPMSLTTALLIERLRDKKSFILMLGSISEFAIGADVCETSDNELFADIQERFCPKPLGHEMRLKCHTVRINAEDLGLENQMVYFIDIEIDEYPSAAADVLEKDQLVTRTSGRGHFRDQMKRLLKK